MTRFYINEREINPPPDITSFNQLLTLIEEMEIPANSVIRMIQIDGIPVMPDAVSKDFRDFLEQKDCHEKIEITTGTVEEIAMDSIRQAIEYLGRVEDGTPSLAISFQMAPGPEAFENLRQLYEGFYWLNLLLDKLASNFDIVFNEIRIQGIPAGDHHRKFIEILKQLVDSQERGDMVLISDLLEYEILPMVPVWKDMFESISQKVGMKQ
jgi:hypothetical protein